MENINSIEALLTISTSGVLSTFAAQAISYLPTAINGQHRAIIGSIIGALYGVYQLGVDVAELQACIACAVGLFGTSLVIATRIYNNLIKGA